MDPLDDVVAERVREVPFGPGCGPVPIRFLILRPRPDGSDFWWGTLSMEHPGGSETPRIRLHGNDSLEALSLVVDRACTDADRLSGKTDWRATNHGGRERAAKQQRSDDAFRELEAHGVTKEEAARDLDIMFATGVKANWIQCAEGEAEEERSSVHDAEPLGQTAPSPDEVAERLRAVLPDGVWSADDATATDAIAERVYIVRLAPDAAPTRIRLLIDRPQYVPDDRGWVCTLDVCMPHGSAAARLTGEDSLEALSLALDAAWAVADRLGVRAG
jgi:hypothetical protein